MVIKRRSADSPNKIIPLGPCPDSTHADESQNSDSEGGNCDGGLQTNKEKYGKEADVKNVDVCSDVINNKEIKLCIKFSDICVTELDWEEPELPGPRQVSLIKPISGCGKRIILSRKGKIINEEKDLEDN